MIDIRNYKAKEYKITLQTIFNLLYTRHYENYKFDKTVINNLLLIHF